MCNRRRQRAGGRGAVQVNHLEDTSARFFFRGVPTMALEQQPACFRDSLNYRVVGRRARRNFHPDILISPFCTAADYYNCATRPDKYSLRYAIPPGDQGLFDAVSLQILEKGAPACFEWRFVRRP